MWPSKRDLLFARTRVPQFRVEPGAPNARHEDGAGGGVYVAMHHGTRMLPSQTLLDPHITIQTGVGPESYGGVRTFSPIPMVCFQGSVGLFSRSVWAVQIRGTGPSPPKRSGRTDQRLL